MRAKKPETTTANILTLQSLFLILAFTILSACTSDPKAISPLVTRVSRVQKALMSLATSYEKEEPERFIDQLDPDSALLASLKESIHRDFKRFSQTELSFVIDRVEIEEESFLSIVRWKGTWKTDLSTEPLKRQGSALFFWVDRKNPKLTEIRGDSPFGAFSKTK